MDLNDALRSESAAAPTAQSRPAEGLRRYIELQLRANGLLPESEGCDEAVWGLLRNHREKTRLLFDHRCAADRRVEDFLAVHCAECPPPEPLRLPERTLVLDRPGMARELSLPADRNVFVSPYVHSYRVANGVLHNPRHDRRTTQGTFHVAEGGLPIPADKRAVPKPTFAALFRLAVQPPDDLRQLPYAPEARCIVSLAIRPLVSPGVAGVAAEKRMEIRFFAPGGLVSNLDFVESIFGNAGDPYLPENDAGLDVERWSGHSGAVILAPHLERATKREVGLPQYENATDRQRRDGMCWRHEDELYNDGKPFKLTCRTSAGVIVTLIADNYYGYCKKEVKTQISYAANLLGNAEEEHAGGTLAFASYNLGDEFQVNSRKHSGRTLADIVQDYPDQLDLRPEGFALDRKFPDLLYIAEDALISLRTQDIRWQHAGEPRSLPLLPGKIYMAPSGFRIRMDKHPEAPTWRLRGTVAQGTFCHKPCTVSGGGKSEISKSLRDYMLYGPIFVADLAEDLRLVEEIFEKDYARRWQSPDLHRATYAQRASRPILSAQRSLGSVIKLLTPSHEYSADYNRWLARIPNRIYALVFLIKRFYEPEWGTRWSEHFRVDIVNGSPGHELKYGDRELVGTYLRVGLTGDRSWRTFKCRQDFMAAEKIQTEDDISVSTVVPRRQLDGLPGNAADSVKIVENCEFRLFQRPDDAIHRGFDKQTEADLARGDVFLSNFEPLPRQAALAMAQRVVDFDRFSEPMQRFLRAAGQSEHGYVVCSANPRLVDGTPTKNPRYLQERPDLAHPIDRHAAEMGTRLLRELPAEAPLHSPVHAVLIGRRNNPPNPAQGIRGLAVYSPIHYQELPELFMDFIASLTGKSPSTTGFGSEGALTKGPFNALRPAADLNAAFVGYALTGLGGFSTAAGHIGPGVEVGHDISLLVPEIWCRLAPEERDPRFLLEHGLLDRLEDYDYNGRRVPASRLGYRINAEFVRRFLGRLFDNPAMVLDETVLRPESQDPEAFATGIQYIAEAHETVACQYFEDGSAEAVCPPLQALLAIMAFGEYEGLGQHSAEFRALFTREAVLASDWYRERLRTKQAQDIRLGKRLLAHITSVKAGDATGEVDARLDLASRLAQAQAELERVSAPAYLDFLAGSIGAQSFD